MSKYSEVHDLPWEWDALIDLSDSERHLRKLTDEIRDDTELLKRRVAENDEDSVLETLREQFGGDRDGTSL